ncbi:MAG: hypothetical protein K2O54_08265 [Prevotella sp.]|nr:hypothetical protein [Prevotella sp.]
MKEIFLSYFEVSLAISIIIAALILLSSLLNKRYAAKWKYLIWIFIALRLLIPLGGSDGLSMIDILPNMKTQTESGEIDANIQTDAAIPSGRIIVKIPEQMTMPIMKQSS